MTRLTCLRILTAGIALLSYTSLCMATLTLADGGVHNIDYEVDGEVWVDQRSPGTATKLNVLEGASIFAVQTYGDSIINVSGGLVTFLISDDESRIGISGGSLLALAAYGNSEISVCGGSTEELYALDGSQITVAGGTVRYLSALFSSQITISEGSMEELYALESSCISVSGGSIGNLVIADFEGILTIHGSDFAVDGTKVGCTELSSTLGLGHHIEPIRRLTGTLLNGDLLNTDFQIGNRAKIVLIPEPITVLLLGLGGLMVRKRGEA